MRLGSCGYVFECAQGYADDVGLVNIAAVQGRAAVAAKVLGNVSGGLVGAQKLLTRADVKLLPTDGGSGAKSCAMPAAALRAMAIEDRPELTADLVSNLLA